MRRRISMHRGGQFLSFFCIVFFVFVLCHTELDAQYETAMPFLRMSPSPLMNGMGQTGTAIPTNEAYAFYYNPAHLGQVTPDANAVFQFYPSPTDWLPGFNFSDLTFNSMAFNLGYAFDLNWHDVKVHTGLGYMYTRLDLGENVVTDENGILLGKYDSWESYHAIGAGVGIEYYARFSMGLTYKSAKSNLGEQNIQVGAEQQEMKFNADIIDYGLQFYLPVLRFYTDPIRGETRPVQSWLPVLDVSVGYAKTNIGEKTTYSVYYPDLVHLPRTARLGYGLSAGLEWYYENLWYLVISAEYTVDTQDLLIKNGEIQSGLLGDIAIGKNLIQGIADENVNVHKGFRLQFFETFHVLNGSWARSGTPVIETSGYLFSLKGILKYLASTSTSSAMKYIGHHFDMQYVYSDMDGGREDPLSGTEYKSLSILYRNFLW